MLEQNSEEKQQVQQAVSRFEVHENIRLRKFVSMDPQKKLGSEELELNDFLADANKQSPKNSEGEIKSLKMNSTKEVLMTQNQKFLQDLNSHLGIQDDQKQNKLDQFEKISTPPGSGSDSQDSNQSIERTETVQNEQVTNGARPRRNSWTNMTGRQFRRLLSQSQQTRMLVKAHFKEYYRTSPICIIVVACMFYWIMCVIALSLSPLATDDDTLDMAFTRPLYPAFGYDEKNEKWANSQTLIKEQEVKWEGFFQYINQTNTKRTDENGKRVDSWTPLLDVLSPAIFYPINCFTSDPELYDSPIVAYIKSDSDLQRDLIQILENQFEDQRALRMMLYDIIDWMRDIDLAEIFKFIGIFVPPEYLQNLQQTDAFMILLTTLKEPKSFQNLFLDVAGFVEMPADFKSVAIYGGGLYLPEFNYPSRILKNFGQFQFKEFESKGQMFEYVRQQGYGWDKDKPAICLGINFKQDDDNKDYELEVFLRDQFDRRLAGTFSPDMPASPRYLSLDQTWAMNRATNSGMQNMQAYGANLLLKKLTGNKKASIMNAIAPIKIRWDGVYKGEKPYLIIFPFMFSMIYFYCMLPFYLYFAYSIVSEKEQGVRAKLLSSGMTYRSYFLSWQITMTTINIVITLLITVPIYFAVLRGWNFFILFSVFLLCGQTIIGLIWTVQSLYNSARLSAVYAGFAYGASFLYSNAIRQQMPYIPRMRILLTCLAPMSAVKHTLDSYGAAMEGNYAIDFNNITFEAFNFSTADGLIMLFIDYLLFNLIGYLIDKLFYSPEQSETMITAPFRHTHNQKPSKMTELEEDKNVNDDISTQYPTTRNLVVNNLSLAKIKVRNTVKGMFADYKVSPQQDKLYYGSQADILNQKENVRRDSAVRKYINGEGLSFQMRRSQIICFLGGYEKDTSNILKAICGKLEVESNQVFLNGRDINIMNKSFVTQQVSYCKAEEYTLFEKLTAHENIQIFSKMAKRANFDEISEISQQFIDQNKLVEQLNQAERSMLQLLITLMCLQKQILVLDEPTLYFNKEEREAAIRLIKSYKKGRFVLIKCSTDPCLIDLLADKYVVFPLTPSLKINVHKYSKGMKANRSFKVNFKDIDQMPKLVSYLRNKFQEATFQITQVQGCCCTVVCTSDGLTPVNEVSLFEDQKQFTVTSFEELDSDLSEEYDKIFASPAQLANFNSPIPTLSTNMTNKPSDQNSPVKQQQNKIGQNDQKINQSQKFFSFFRVSKLVKLKQGVPLKNKAPCCKQFKFFLGQMRAQNRHNYVQYISTYIFPALLVTIGYLSSRYHYTHDSESRVLSPDWLPIKQPILINDETVADHLSTQEILKYFPDYESYFEPTLAPLNKKTDNYHWYRDAVYQFSSNKHERDQENQGNYFFYKMDRENHDYQMMSFFNVTTYHSMNLFPQFAYEATLRYATEDPDIKFKVRSSPMPMTADIDRSYFTGEELYNSKKSLFVFQNAQTLGTLVNQILLIVGLAYMMIGTAVMVTVMSERPDEQNKARIKSSSWKVTTNENTNKFAYWTAHYLNDLTYFIPCTLILLVFILIFDRYMKVTMICVVIFPFYFLPMLYVFSYICKEERRSISSVAMFLLLVLTFGGLLLMVRFPPPFEVFGDAFYDWTKYFPTFNLSRSIMYSGKMLEILDLYRERSKTGLGDSIDPDEWSMSNGTGDIVLSLFQILVWWTILLVFIELGLLKKICCCFDRQRSKVYEHQPKEEEFSPMKTQEQAVEICILDLEKKFQIKQSSQGNYTRAQTQDGQSINYETQNLPNSSARQLNESYQERESQNMNTNFAQQQQQKFQEIV